ncbi:MAG: hypothetical protein KGL39_60065 [Patescibacteria group bacterium]|nr:hypothetical protein [Patescibacteria group bacterium]
MDELPVLKAVESYCYDRASELTPWNLIGFSSDDRDRLKTDGSGHCVIRLENIEVVDVDTEDHLIVEWLVQVTTIFEVVEGEEIEGSTDIYKAYRLDDGRWHVEWDSE